MRRCFAMAALVVCQAIAVSAPAGILEDAWRALDERRIAVDTQRVSEAALQAAIMAMDPRATWWPSGTTNAATPPPPMLDGLEHWSNGIVRVRLTGSGSGCEDGLAHLRAELATNSAGLVLDLRGAGGDDLDALDRLCGLFLPAGTALYQVVDGHGAQVDRHVAPAGMPGPATVPVALLVDHDTRGTSEALAAILRNRSGFMLLGARTSGDSAHRERFPLTAGMDVYMATGWLVPAGGRDHYRDGIEPHIAIAGAAAIPPVDTNAPPAADATDHAAMAGEPEWQNALSADPALRRAVDVLLGLHALQRPDPFASGVTTNLADVPDHPLPATPAGDSTAP